MRRHWKKSKSTSFHTVRPVLPLFEYEYKNIFVLVGVNWCGEFEIFRYKYRNVFVATQFSPRTHVAFVFSEYGNENEFVIVFSVYRTYYLYKYKYKYRNRTLLLRRNGIPQQILHDANKCHLRHVFLFLCVIF